MIHYLLDQKGMQSSALWYYSIRDHGPYSHDFEQSLLNAIHFDLVQETTGRRTSDGAAYTIFATTEPPSILAALASEPAKDLILRMTQQSATILELAASAHWFIIHEQDPDWKTTLRHRKGALADNGRLETAAAFLHVLDLLPSAHISRRGHPLTPPKEITMHLIPEALCARMLANDRNLPNDDDPFPVVRLFTPGGGATWLLTVIDTDNPDSAFGLCDTGQGFPELGYLSLTEIASIRGPLGLLVERDHSFEPQFPLSVYAKAACQTGSIAAGDPEF